MEINQENFDKLMTVLISASSKSRTNELKIDALYEFVGKLIEKHDLDQDGELRDEIVEKLKLMADQSFYTSEFAQQFPEYIAASDEKNEGLIDGLLDHLSGDDNDPKDD